jgi:hypothetical protein
MTGPDNILRVFDLADDEYMDAGAKETAAAGGRLLNVYLAHLLQR